MQIIFILVTCILINPYLKAQSIDYSIVNNWAAHGEKFDNSDKIPKDLKSEISNTSIANVFFIHPTSYTKPLENNQKLNASIKDSVLNKYTDESSILFQASCFNQFATVYAPRYRQAHLQVFFTKTKASENALDTAYADVKLAFEYFIKFLNKNKPIIIAAHSQGTVHAARLLKDFFENKPLQNKLVAAYLIGMPIYNNYFSTLQPCTNPTSIGCFVSWRSYLQNTEGEKYIQNEKTNSVYVINPLSFTLDTLAVGNTKNEGAVLLKFDKVLKNVSGAQVHNNILWVTKPKFPFSFLVKNKRTNYHIADINLFYINIRKNVAQRLKAFGAL